MGGRRSQSDVMLTPVGAGPVTRRMLLTIVLVLTAFFLLAPLVLIFASALSQGLGVFFKNLTDPAISYAIWLTLLTALFAKNGWFGAPLDALGIPVAYTPLGIALAMAFTSVPFVVRTVQPVIEDLGTDCLLYTSDAADE